MISRTRARALILVSVLLMPIASANAQDSLKKQAGDLMGSQAATGQPAGAASLLSRLKTGSLNPLSMQNAAGVLGYCQKQGYTQGATQQVKSKLMNKLGGSSQAQQNKGYQQGLSGLLKGSNGQMFSLKGLSHKIGQRVCTHLADRATSSFLGG